MIRALPALAVSSFLLLHAAPASSFCRARSCESQWSIDNATHFAIPCVQDQRTNCLLYGPLLHWPTNCLTFSVQRDGSDDDAIDLDTATAIIEAAFETWRGADCGGGEAPSFTVRNAGPVECRRVEYNQDDGNANIFMFRDDTWPHPIDEDQAIALTTTTYNVDTGEIVDADVEFNSRDFTLATTDGVGVIDLASVTTHEVGHFLGLSHSPFPAAVMWSTSRDSAMRTLHADDVDGICTIYPPGETLSSSCPVRHGFSGECGTRPPSEGCTFAPSGPRSDGRTPTLVLLAVAFGFRWMHRRSRRSALPSSRSGC